MAKVRRQPKSERGLSDAEWAQRRHEEARKVEETYQKDFQKRTEGLFKGVRAEAGQPKG